MNGMTVNILGTRGIPAAHGGFETFVEALALHLARRGHRVRVYCQWRGALSRRERSWNGIELVEISLPLGGALSTMVFDLLSTIDAVRRGGTVLTCGYNTSPLFLLYRLFGVRNVVNMDGIEWRRPKWSAPARLWLWCCERVGLHLADEVIADHPEIARHLLRRTFQREIHVVPYGTATPPPVDSSVLARHGLALKRYATVVARPEPENSILEIVEAWSLRPRGLPLVIVGDYEGEANAWRTRVKDAAGDEVRFIGEVRGGDELSSLRRGACLYIHGHTVGGTNPSALEALAAGNPVLAHDNPFNRWVVADAAVYFSDRDSCARALDELLGDAAVLEKLGARALELAHERFGLETCHLAYERLLAPRALAGADFAATRSTSTPATRMPVAQNRSAGGPCLPARQDILLVEAALADSTPMLREAWEAWRRGCPDLEGMAPAEYRLLPRVWRRVEHAGLADGDAARLRGILKKAWFHNHHLLQEAGRIQQELSQGGISSLLGRECGLLAMAFEGLGDCSTIAVDLLVPARHLRNASRILRRRRSSMWFDGVRVTFRGEGLAPAHLQVADETAFGRGEHVAHASQFLEVADPATLLFAHLLDLFERAPGRDLSPARWLVDLSVVLAARPQVEEALLGRIRAAHKVALFQHHFAAAEQSLPRVVPPFVRRVAATEPPPAEARISAALGAFTDAGFVPTPVVGEAAWWMAQRGADPRSPSNCMTARYLKNRAIDFVRNAMVDPRSTIRVIRAPRHYLRSALAIFRRKPDGTHQP